MTRRSCCFSFCWQSRSPCRADSSALAATKSLWPPEIAESAHIAGSDFAKMVIVKIDGRMAMVVVPSHRKIVLSDLRDFLLSDKVELATEDEFKKPLPSARSCAAVRHLVQPRVATPDNPWLGWYIMNAFDRRGRDSVALLTDLYELTMAYGYWKHGMTAREAVFHVAFRTLPFEGGYAVAAGLGVVVHFLSGFRFSDDDLMYLATLRDRTGGPLFETGFLDHLRQMEFACDVDAMPEGTLVFPHEPLLRVSGPIEQAQIVETMLLNTLNFQTLIATKAARTCLAAEGDPVIEFGLRRAQGVDGGLAASRAAYVGGCDSTSNVARRKNQLRQTLIRQAREHRTT